MKRLITLLLTLCTVICPLASGFVSEAADYVYPGFIDVPENSWFYRPVRAAYGAGLFSGTGENTFSPHIPMTRAMVVTVLSKMYGGDISGFVNTKFADVPSGSWFEHAVSWAEFNGIVSGTDGTHFSPDMLITREQICVILGKCALLYDTGAYYKYDNLHFDDSAAISSWAVDAVELMQMYGVIRERSGGSFEPKATVSRAEVCNMIVYFSGNHGSYSKDTTVRVSGLGLSACDISLEQGQTYTLKAILSPANAEIKDVSFASSDPGVASVSPSGGITALSPGCTVVTAAALDGGYTASCVVLVTEKPRIVTVNGVTYVDGVLIANKTYSLPASYNPGGLTYETQAAFSKLQSAAAKEGLSFYCASGFRSYSLQQRLYDRYVAQDGKAAADRYSARPGHSEHQTGLALDVNMVDQSFAYTREGKWLAANCYKYGFIIRYPKNKESVTGYMYEPWHIRYLGVDLAAKVYESGLCLEEYLGITSVYG